MKNSSLIRILETVHYQEQQRPQYHFTAKEGWINDPNGLVYVDGVYHLFFQHEEKQWGHAISTDLLHWEQLATAIEPWRGHQVYSGSAILDVNNTSGFSKNRRPPIVAIFTSWGEGQCLAYSNDNGTTFTRYEENPVLRLPGDQLKSWPLSARDPMVFRDQEHDQWIMLLYSNPDQHEEKYGAGISVFTSDNLIQWDKRSHLDGFYVCPDMCELSIDGEDGATAFAIFDWEQYVVGSFDNCVFNPAQSARSLDSGDLSANQTWKDLPDGRIIQISWLRHGKYPGMPFDQQLSFPVELSLRRMKGELVLCKTPINEIFKLHKNEKSFCGVLLEDGKSIEYEGVRDCLDLCLEFGLDGAATFVISICGVLIEIQGGSITCRDYMGTVPGDVAVKDLRLLIDRTSIELFANGGSLSLSFCLIPDDGASGIRLGTTGGPVTINSLIINEVSSIWD